MDMAEAPLTARLQQPRAVSGRSSAISGRDGVNEQNNTTTSRLLRGALAGLIAGVVASVAMDGFQAAVAALSSSSEDEGEPATEKAADAIATTITGTELAKRDKPLAGQAIHYALGIGLGVAYGVAAEFRPAATVGHGIGLGLVTATLLDEAAVPAVGLGDPPWKAGVSSNLYAYASHLVFGGTTELVRRHVVATLTG